MSESRAARFERAINNHLDSGEGKKDDNCKPYYSCWAVDDANDINIRQSSRDIDFLEKMGVDGGSQFQFEEFPAGPKRQFARALWLTWAALMAKEKAV